MSEQHGRRPKDDERSKQIKRESARRLRADPVRWAAYLAKKRAAAAARREADPEWAERQRRAAQEWKKRNPEKVSEYKKRDYWLHQERVKRSQRAWYARVRKEYLARKRELHKKNPEEARERQRRWRAEDPERSRNYQLRHKAEHPSSWRLYGIRKTAKAKGIECDLDRQWFDDRISAGVCEMSGLPFDLHGKRTPNSPSVDRVDPAGPYTKANCRLILWWLNRAMLNLGEDYAISVFKAVIARRA